MNDPNLSGIQLTTPADSYAVAPGGKLEIPLVLSNEGSIPDQVRIGVEGIPLVWVSAEQQVVMLQPGEQSQITLVVQPPALPNAQIGRYILTIRAASLLQPARVAQTQAALTVAGYEVKGRVGVLLESLRFSVVPGERLAIRAVLINQGLGVDTFALSLLDLPEGWTEIPQPVMRLQPGEIQEAVLLLQPPRHPSARASRYPFRIQVASREAPDQSVSIDCILTVAAFIAFESALEAAQPEQELPRRVKVENLSNIPVSFTVSWGSPEEALVFEPQEPQSINLPSGETTYLEYAARPARRPWFGGEKASPYTVKVQASDRQIQTLEGSLLVKGWLPTWALVAGLVILALLCLVAIWSVWAGSSRRAEATPTLTQAATVAAPTPTQSPIDQRPLLIERKWYLASVNDAQSRPGAQEAFSLFNPNGTLIGFTGCKDLSANYQTDFNRISITNVNLGPGACPDSALQRQEDALLAILRSARSYFVADTVLQIAGDAGFLSYSLTPLDRPEGILPPQAAIQMAPQSQVGQVVVFDGSASSGQAPLVSWRWDFGDGVSASGTVVQHTYANAGTFTVRLTVTDQRGQSGTTSGQIHILPLPTPQPTPTLASPSATPVPPTQPPVQPTLPPEPTAEPPTATPEPPPAPVPPQASIAGPRRGYIGEPVGFDASASQPGSSPITSFRWSLGNGVNLPDSPEASAMATYNRAGDYEVAVFVTDANGLSSYATTRITIDARLDTVVWRLSLIDTAPLLPATAITLQFKDGEVAGFASCNTYQGQYTATLNDDGSYTIVIQRLRTSRQSCPQAIMDQEQKYLALLEQATLAVIQENRIVLSSPSGNLVYYLIE